MAVVEGIFEFPQIAQIAYRVPDLAVDEAVEPAQRITAAVGGNVLAEIVFSFYHF